MKTEHFPLTFPQIRYTLTTVTYGLFRKSGRNATLSCLLFCIFVFAKYLSDERVLYSFGRTFGKRQHLVFSSITPKKP